MDLHEYPQAIRDRQAVHNRAVRAVLKATDQVHYLKLSYQNEAANTEELTNETKRKAYIADCMSSDEYHEALYAAEQAKHAAEEAEQDLELMRNQFSVAKLYFRRDLVSQEHTQFA